MPRTWMYCVFVVLVAISPPACPQARAQQHNHPEASAEKHQAVDASSPLGLELDQLEQLALKHNPTLAQAALLVDASRAKALQAGLQPNPTVGFKAERIGAQGTAGDFQGGFVEQTIISAGKLRLSRAKYAQEAVEAEWLTLAQQLRVLNCVRMAFFQVLASERLLRLRNEVVQNAEEHARTKREMLNIGLANAAEVLEAEVDVDRAKIALQEIENQVAGQIVQLGAIVGAPECVRGPLQGALEPSGPLLNWPESLECLLQESPELQAARANVVRDNITLQRERLEPIPNVAVRTGAGYDFETRRAVADVEVGVKLPLWNKNRGTIRQADADLARSHTEVQRMELSLRASLAKSFQDYRTARAKALLYRDSALPKARQAYELMLDQHKKKRAEWIQVVEYQRKLLQLQEDYIHAALAWRRADIAIRGLLLADGLHAPSEPRPGGHLEVSPDPR